jgi:hypothetical protein
MAARTKRATARVTGAATADHPAKEPSKADRTAQAEQQVPIEPVGPGVEHEDHEGGLTDSLAKKGVRAPLPTAEEKAEATKDETTIVRAPSVRERQTGIGASVARGGMVRLPREIDKDGNEIYGPIGAAQVQAAQPGARIIPVIALRLGQYPADGRLRAPGEAFDYVMNEQETKLPSWMRDARGTLESRGTDEPSGVAPEPLVLELVGAPADATVTVRRGGGTHGGGRSVL